MFTDTLFRQHCVKSQQIIWSPRCAWSPLGVKLLKQLCNYMKKQWVNCTSWFFLGTKSFTRASSLFGKKKSHCYHASTIRNVKCFDMIFFSCHWGAQSNKGKHQDVHAADRTAAHRYHFTTWQQLPNHCSCREFLMVQKGSSKGPQSPLSLFKAVSKAARNRCPSVAAVEITQVKLVAGNKGFPQNSFISSFLGTYYHDRGNWESKKLSWQHSRPLPQAKQNEFPSFPSQCNL